MDKLNELQGMIDGMKADAEKFYAKKQNAAGTRLRKQLNEIKKKCSDMRREIQETRNARKG